MAEVKWHDPDSNIRDVPHLAVVCDRPGCHYRECVTGITAVISAKNRTKRCTQLRTLQTLQTMGDARAGLTMTGPTG